MSATPISDVEGEREAANGGEPEQPPTDGRKGAQKSDRNQIRFQFCRECSNLLYPKEDRSNNTLLYSCRTCHFVEPAASACIYRHDLSNSVGETAGVTQDVGGDPTVGAFDFCTLCGQELQCGICGEGLSGVESCDDDDDDDNDNDNNELPRTDRQCPSCPEKQAVFFQSQQRSAETGMKLFYVCCGCGTIFE